MASVTSSVASSVSVPSESSNESSSAMTLTNRNSTNGAHVSENKNGVIVDNSAIESDLLLEKFITACTPMLKFPDDEKIVQKLRRHYGRVAMSVRHELHPTLKSSTIEVQEEGAEVYLIITNVDSKFKNCGTQLTADYTKKAAHIKKLEKILQKLDRKIKQLQEQEIEVDDDEDENSAYILECRLKARFSKVWNKLCQVVGQSEREPVDKISYKGSRFPEINKNIGKFLKKKAGVFPDFKTILEVVEETNREFALRLCDKRVEDESRAAFSEVGKLLQQRRITELTWTIGCHLTDDDEKKDPALEYPELKKNLEVNQEIGCKKMQEVINKYAQLQEEFKEEPVEYALNDQNGEESYDEDEDDECDEDLDESSHHDSDISSQITTDIDDNSTDSKQFSKQPPAQSMKRERSSVDKEVSNSKAKKRAVLQSFDDSSMKSCDEDDDEDSKQPSAQSMKQEKSSVGKEVSNSKAKKRAVLQPFEPSKKPYAIIDEDDVIVLSD